jgi:hypothetical protein
MTVTENPSRTFGTSAKSARAIRIGCGAGFSGDRIDPAVALAERGALDYLVFECLAERTIALAIRERLRNPNAGYDPLLEERMHAVLPAAARNRVRIISNMGAANPAAAARRTAEIVRQLGLGPLKIAAVLGDDVLPLVFGQDDRQIRMPETLHGTEGGLISANAYLGCEPIVEALREGADIVLTGRVADPSLFLAPLVHEFAWAMDDWDRLGRGTVAGHLLECAGQITGGYFADPGFKDVPGMADLGFPIAEVDSDAGCVITKLEDCGGQVTIATCKEQLLYELHDPARYITPDVVADFSTVSFEQLAPHRVAVRGGGGARRPAYLKVCVGYQEGYAGEGQISYAGPGAAERGRLALAIVKERLQRWSDDILELRLDLIGVDSVFGGAAAVAPEVRVRVAARTRTLAAATAIGREVEALYTNGPAGGGGAAQGVKPVIAIESAFVRREAVVPRIQWESLQ